MRTKIFLFTVMLIGLLSAPAFAEQATPQVADHMGIKWEWKIKAENYTFDVITVSNYDMKNVTFSKQTKELIFLGNSTHTGNIVEIEIPHNLIGGNLTVTQDGGPVSSIIILGKDSSTIMLKSNQTGMINTHVVGTTYLPEFSSIAPLVMVLSIIIVLFTIKLKF